MNRVKCSSSRKNSSKHSSIITVCNRGKKPYHNQLARRSNLMKSNWTFRRAKWLDVIPKLINSFVNGVDNDFLRIHITQK